MTTQTEDRERIDEGRGMAEFAVRSMLGHGRDFADMATVTFTLAHHTARKVHAALVARGASGIGGGWVIHMSTRDALRTLGVEPPRGSIPVMVSAGRLNLLVGLPPDIFASGARGTA